MIKITIVKQTVYKDLIDKYELPLENACDLHVGDVFYTDGISKPDLLCESAWETIAPFAKRLSEGDYAIYGNWMRNPKSAMISCNDGFRPTSFLIEVIDY